MRKSISYLDISPKIWEIWQSFSQISHIFGNLFTRLLKINLDSTQSIFLFGPRGTGKTHWVKQHFNNALYLDLLDTAVLAQLVANPNRLESLIPPKFRDWIIIDEVQKVPAILNEVHRLIENKRFKLILWPMVKRLICF
ncbi:MAG: AAA family ATPase [Coxiellaceae bacterium]|nr:MAG: AAA family ATPase [Coxiellaceae bacterium]